MRIVLTSFGSTGDVQPFLALAFEFLRRGHQPALALSPNFAPRARALGIECVPLGPELDPALIRGVGTTLVREEDPAEQVRHFLAALQPHVPQMYRDLLRICRNSEALVSSPFQLVGRMVYDTAKIPFASVHMSQFGALGTKIVRDASAPMINACRAEQGLEPLPDPLGVDGTSPELALYGVSRAILRRPANWPAHHHVVGFLFLDEEHWQAPQKLLDFLGLDGPPILVNFGSMVHEDPDAVTKLILEAISRTGRRAIIQHGWSGLAQQELPKDVFAMDFAPHSWLLPRVGCVVHHGGAGTTAATFRAGVPSIVVPHTLDQPIWGEFARALGCAAAVIPYSQLTAGNLSEAIGKAMDSPRYRVAATAFSRRIQAEAGAATACKLVEDLVLGRKSRCYA